MKPKTNVRGAKRLFNALLYSFSGLKALIRETAFRQELFFAILLLSSLILIQANALHILIALVIILITFSIEALNTAIEEIVDHISPEWSEVGKKAKDLGSFAVFCLLLSSGIFIGYVYWVTLTG